MDIEMNSSLNRMLAVAAVGVLMHVPCEAAVYQGTIANVAPFNGKVYFVISNGAFDGSAGSCPAGTAMVYSIDPATPFGRAQIATALAAKLSGRLVWAVGDGICSAGSPFGGSEGLTGLDLKG